MKGFLVCFGCLLCFAGYAQNLLKGKVSDAADHSPVPGATVYFPDLKRGSNTDAQGRFLIDHLPHGNFLVEIRYVGYANFIRAVLLDSLTELNVELERAITELNEVVVTGVSHSSELRNNPLPISTLNQNDLTENTATNLVDNISKKAGVSQITTGPAISKPIIRGLGYTRIISLYDGIRQEGQQWGDEHGLELDEYSVDKVEIIKGAGSLMYGSDGLGGVLNFLTSNPIAEGRITGKWISNFQSNNGLFGNSIVTAGNKHGIYWLLRGSRKDAGAYANAYDGKVFNSGFKEQDFNGHLGISKAWGYSQMNFSSFQQSLGLTEGNRDNLGRFTREVNLNGSARDTTVSDKDLNSYHIFVPRQEIVHFRVSNATNLYFGQSHIQLSLGIQRNQRKEYGDVLHEQLKNLYFDLHTFTYNLIYFLPEISAWQISFGTSGMGQQNENKGVAFLIPAYHSFDWGGFFFAKRHLERFDISGGLRFDQRRLAVEALYLDANGIPTADQSATIKFHGGHPVFSNYSASAGLTYQFSRILAIKANFSRGFRAPNIAELASNGRHEGSLRYEYGNYNLKAETSLQVDVGMMLNSKHITAEFSFFQNNIQNYIYTQRLRAQNGHDSIPDPTQPVPAYQFMAGNAQLLGGEFFIDLHPHPLDWLHFENGFSFVNAMNRSSTRTDSTKYLPFIPAPRFQSELRAKLLKSGKSVSNTFVKVECNYHWSQRHVLLENHTESFTPGYTLWNAGTGTDFVTRKGETWLSLYLSINNIFDVAYQSNMSRLKYAATNPLTGRTGVFNMGRNVSLKVVIPVVFRKAE